MKDMKFLNTIKKTSLAILSIVFLLGTTVSNLSATEDEKEDVEVEDGNMSADCEKKPNNICLEVGTPLGTITKKGILRVRL